MTGSYDIPVASLTSLAIFSNTTPTTPYRSSGRPEVTYAIERLVDQVAVTLGIDRIEKYHCLWEHRGCGDVVPQAKTLEDSRCVGAKLDAVADLGEFAGLFQHLNIKAALGKR